MAEREVLGRRKETFGDLVVWERNWAASHWITSFHLPCPPLISALGSSTPLLGKSFGEQNEKCSSSTSTIEGSGNSKLACKTDSIYREDTYIYIWKGSASPMSKSSLQIELDLSRTCSKLPLSMPWGCSDKAGGGTGELFSAWKAY